MTPRKESQPPLYLLKFPWYTSAMFTFHDDLLSESPLPPLREVLSAPEEEPSYGVPDLDDRRAWQKHTMTMLYKHSFDPDPKISLQALDKIAKTSVAGLSEERVVMDVRSKSMDELKSLLFDKVHSILARDEKVISVQ